jgi:lactam utilization protein B
MPQTALEWFIDRILEGKCQVVYTKDIGYLFYQTEDIIEQAKAMEKEQIIKAVDINFNYDNNGYPTLGEQYYNETYGNTNSN